MSPPPLRRPAPAPYFHPLPLIFQIATPPAEVIKIHFTPFLKKGGGCSELCGGAGKIMARLGLYDVQRQCFVDAAEI